MYNKVSTKYRVKELLNQLPKADYDLAMKQLPDYLGVARQTFSKILNVKENEQYEPSSGTLIKIASFFNCPVENLLSTKPEPITIDHLRIMSAGTTAKELSLSKL